MEQIWKGSDNSFAMAAGFEAPSSNMKNHAAALVAHQNHLTQVNPTIQPTDAFVSGSLPISALHYVGKPVHAKANTFTDMLPSILDNSADIQYLKVHRDTAGAAPALEQGHALWLETEKIAKMGSWGFRVDTQTFSCSENLYAILGISGEKELEGFHALLSAVTEMHRDQLVEAWNTVIVKQEELEHTVQLAGSRSETWVRFKLKPCHQNGTLEKIIGTVQDVSDIVAKENKLLAEKEYLKQALQVKSDFVSFMSHEIRTPLNAIIGFSHLLLQKDQTESEHKENLQAIHFSSQNLLGLINTTLEYSRIEAGKIELEQVSFKLKHLLMGVHRSLSLRAAEKNLGFYLNLDENIPEEVTGDPTRLMQILNNLLSNAIKFTERGKVSLTVNGVYQSDQDWVIEFVVSDTGPGIPAERQQQVFESFVQASASTHRLYGGTGLGLAITRKLVDLHKGHIQLESNPGEGSTFKVLLKYKKSFAIQPLLPQEAEETGAGLSALRHAKVLLVDDNISNTTLASKLLTSWKSDVVIAENGLEALDKASAADFDLVLMDLHMPVMNGYDAISELRQRGYQGAVVAFTANYDDAEKENVLAIGANDYLTKPFVPHELYNRLSSLLARTPVV
ncbi:ATP-binding protein [Pontibacter sp. SGAir0037]|uniref:ATP-binding response regulator n=1 Tax=Pontibacter sp. SGAir0037 TaxID=2571030 RepID=UPI00143D8CF4|nr:ATP-binding protein [Pontibacter sp. SGAir0037]